MGTTDVVCAGCFGDEDLKSYIVENDGEPGCDFCGDDAGPTVEVGDLGEFMRQRLEQFYSDANEHLMYISAEGGYQGDTYFTYELLTDTVPIDLPRQRGSELLEALCEAIEPDRVWCEYDPAVLDDDDNMLLDWDNFCRIVKYRRRFFFQMLGGSDSILDDRLATADLLNAICGVIDDLEIVKSLPSGANLYRARPWDANDPYVSPCDLGPPREDVALQSNRMNPAGIPMFYASEDEHTALLEVRESPASVGTFVARKRLHLLDLVDLPPIPGMFSTASRKKIMGLRFLHRFAHLITLPVDRDNRTVLDYIPSQVFTEYLRDYRFSRRSIDGIRYRSATTPHSSIPGDGLFRNLASASNIVLFATQSDILEGCPDEGAVQQRESEPWLELLEARHFPTGSIIRP